MNKIKAALVGYGNVGKAVFDAAKASPDVEITHIIVAKEKYSRVPGELNELIKCDDVEKTDGIDVVFLCAPTRSVPELAKKYLSKGIYTVDSFDIHTSIWDLKKELEPIAKANNCGSVISAGWDPGSDSVIRTLLEAMAPSGITYTNFGPGMSMGHTVAVKAIPGVKNALSMTIPLGTGIHRRMVYIEILDGYNFDDIEKAIKSDAYFVKDETHVILVDDVNNVIDVGHGVNMTRKGVSGLTHNQIFEFNMKINNPALTAQVLVSSSRAILKQQPGIYTMPEIPPIDYLYGDKETLIKRLV